MQMDSTTFIVHIYLLPYRQMEEKFAWMKRWIQSLYSSNCILYIHKRFDFEFP